MTLNTFFDFCSGIGGGRIGLEKIGLKCVGYADSARNAPITYKLMHDITNEKNFGNVKRIDGSYLPKFDVFIAGFPCQSFSVIGRKDGLDDSRGQIIFHLSRIINQCRPKCFILENVKGLVTHNDGKTLNIIIHELEKNSYSVFHKILSSCDYGVPQARERIYIIGFDKSLNINNFAWPEPYGTPPLNSFLKGDSELSSEQYNFLANYLKNNTNDNIYTVDELISLDGAILDTRMNDLRIFDIYSPTLRTQRDGILYVKNQKIYELTGSEALLLQGFPTNYINRVKNKISNRHLLMQAGNAMTVTVIEAIGKQIIDTLKGVNSMARGESFEIQCTQYLNKRYGNERITFVNHGGMDSTIPDIQLIIDNTNKFFIEVKMANAQSGQFVVIPDAKTKSFSFSSRNKSTPNEITDMIIDYMNEDFELFSSAGTRGEYISLDPTIFSSWIINNYKSKNVKFVISNFEDSDNSYVIFPIERYAYYFDISAKYREKRSGTNKLAKSHHETAKTKIKNLYPTSEFFTDEKNALHVNLKDELKDPVISLESFDLYLSQNNDNTYQVKRRSNTRSLNVIFSIQLKHDQVQSDLDLFIEAIEE